jgi:hypothetical protein
MKTPIYIMELEIEIILEAAGIISKFPNDVGVLREQRSLITKNVDLLIEAAQQLRAADVTDSLEI